MHLLQKKPHWRQKFRSLLLILSIDTHVLLSIQPLTNIKSALGGNALIPDAKAKFTYGYFQLSETGDNLVLHETNTSISNEENGEERGTELVAKKTSHGPKWWKKGRENTNGRTHNSNWPIISDSKSSYPTTTTPETNHPIIHQTTRWHPMTSYCDKYTTCCYHSGMLL